MEYAAVDIAEYWIIDPLQMTVTICVLEAGRYQDTVYQGNDVVMSPTFPVLQLTAVQMLQMGQ